MAAVVIWAEAEAAVRRAAGVAVPSTEAGRTLAEPVILVACVNSMEAAAMSVHRAPSQGRMECARIRGGMQAMPSTVDPASPRGNAVRHALHARSIDRGLRNHNALRNPAARAALVSAAATAGWHGWRHGDRHGWWRHNHGGYGWVGPLFWPFAYYDVYDYGLWGYDYGPAFWDYGYGDIYAGLFSPYGYDSLTVYLPARRSTSPAASGSSKVADQTTTHDADNQLARLCAA